MIDQKGERERIVFLKTSTVGHPRRLNQLIIERKLCK